MLNILINPDEPKIIDATVENLDEVFRSIFMLIGLREANIPTPLETLFLYQFIRDNYPNHKLSEIRLAFEKAIKFELDLQPSDVKCYENFSVLYLSTIMNAYRKWSGQEYFHIEKFLPLAYQEVKYLEEVSEQYKKFHWGQSIEKEYQHFILFGEERSKLWPAGFYNQLVEDGVFDKDLYMKAVVVVRKKMIAEAVKEREKCQMTLTSIKGEDSRSQYARSMNQTNLNNFQKEIDELKNGDRDQMIVNAAKQYCVLHWFRECKKKNLARVYGPADTTEPPQD